jgi:hypothetical protein
MVLALSMATLAFEQSMVNVTRANHARIVQAEIGTALDRATTDVEAALVAQARSQGGQITSLPTDVADTLSSCPIVDAANQLATDCNGQIKRSIHFAGLANAGGTATETIGNVNTQTVNTYAVQRDVAIEVDLQYVSASGSADGQRVATGHFTVIADCGNAQACAAGQTFTRVTFNGWRDSAGSHSLGAEGLANGKCATGSPGCSSVGLDAGSTATPDDSRIQSQTQCYDPNYVGNGGAATGDRCNQTGNTPNAPQSSSTFANQGMQNGAAANGPLPK